MFIFLLIWTALATLAIVCAARFELAAASAAWGATTALACAIGARLIMRQPLGVATTGGRFGSAIVRWGFRAGRGRLVPAAIISWLIWIVLGLATIAAIKLPAHLPILIACMGDSLGLFYVIGIMLSNASGRIPGSLIKLVLAIIGLIGGGLFLWFRAGTDEARAVAVAIAGGPPLLVGAIYGFVLAMDRPTKRSSRH